MPLLATKRASKAFASLRGAHGWTNIVGKTVAGDTVQCYIDENKNGKQIAMERDGRCAHRAVCKSLGLDPKNNKRVHLLRRDGHILVDEVPIIKIHPIKDAETSLGWNERGVQERGLDKSAILNHFAEAPVAIADVEWTECG